MQTLVADVMFWGFWVSLFFVVWTYVGYPLLMFALSRLSSAPSSDLQMTDTPTKVSIVMAVHNGAEYIVQKCENLLSLRAEQLSLELIVVCDGCTDDTVALARTIPGVSCIVWEQQRGKAAALNAGVEASSGSLVLFCDVRQRLSEDALVHLVNRVMQHGVGAVSGELVMDSDKGPGMYWRYERAIRMAEARFDSTVGATGALYIIRRALFRPLPEGTILDDVYIPLQIALLGYRVGFEPRAKAFDTEVNLDKEFQRKARTLAGNFQLLESMPQLLSPFHNRLFFSLMSHKLFRLLCPYAMMMLLVSSMFLATQGGWWALGFGAFLTLQVICYLFALIGHFGKGGRIGRLCATFLVLNLAAVAGLMRYLKRDFSWSTASAVPRPSAS